MYEHVLENELNRAKFDCIETMKLLDLYADLCYFVLFKCIPKINLLSKEFIKLRNSLFVVITEICLTFLSNKKNNKNVLTSYKWLLLSKKC